MNELLRGAPEQINTKTADSANLNWLLLTGSGFYDYQLLPIMIGCNGSLSGLLNLVL